MPFLYYKLKIFFYPLALFPDVSPMLVQLLQQEHPEHPPPHFPLPILFNCPRKIKNTINTNPVIIMISAIYASVSLVPLLRIILN